MIPESPPRRKPSTTDPTLPRPGTLARHVPAPHEGPALPEAPALARGTAGPEGRPAAATRPRRPLVSPHTPAATTARMTLEVYQ